MKAAVREKIFESGALTVFKPADEKTAAAQIEALKDGGIDVVELSCTDGVPSMLAALCKKCKDTAVGVSVKSADAPKAIEAGAAYILTDDFDAKLAKAAAEADVLYIPTCKSLPAIREAVKAGISLINYVSTGVADEIVKFTRLAKTFVDTKFIITVADKKGMDLFISAPFTEAVRGSLIGQESKADAESLSEMCLAAEQLVTDVHGFTMWHVGINHESRDAACATGDMFQDAFRLKLRDNGPSSRFCGTGIELMKSMYRGKNGHLAIRTNNADRAIRYLAKHGYSMDMSTAYVSDGRIFTVYLDEKHSFGGFAIHLLQRNNPWNPEALS